MRLVMGSVSTEKAGEEGDPEKSEEFSQISELSTPVQTTA
jgi:hypothetical protein